MPNTIPGVDSDGVLESKAALAHSKARVDFGLWGLIRSSSTAGAAGGPGPIRRHRLQGLPRLRASASAASRCCRSWTRTTPTSRRRPTTARCFASRRWSRALGLPLVIHAEDPGILAAFGGRSRRTPMCSPLARPRPRPWPSPRPPRSPIRSEPACTSHTCRARSGLRAAEAAMRDGSRLTLETCPQYLWLNGQRFRTRGDRDEGVSARSHRGRPGGPDRGRRQRRDRNRGDRPRSAHRRGEGEVAG